MALNPITYTEKVVKNFLRYQLTTYPMDVSGRSPKLFWNGRLRIAHGRFSLFVPCPYPYSMSPEPLLYKETNVRDLS